MSNITVNPYNTVTRIAEGPLLQSDGWWPVMGASRRASDDAVVMHIVEYRGGVGEPPPTGFIGPSGLVADVAHAFPFHVVAGGTANTDTRIRALVKAFALQGADGVDTDDLSEGVANTLRDAIARVEISADGAFLQFISGGGTITQFEIADQLVPPTVSKAEAEAGTAVNVRSWTAQRIAQAIAALTPSGGGGTVPTTVTQTAAETGTSTTVRSWTAQRVRQAINAVVRGPARLQSSERWGKAQLPQDIVYTDELPAAPAEVTEAQARAGTLTTVRRWSPLRVAQAISSLAPKVPSTVSQSVAEAGTSTTVRSWTAQRVRQAITAARSAIATQAEAEAGTSTALRSWTPRRIAQAIAALAPSGGGTGVATEIDPVSALPSAAGKEAGTRAVSAADDRWKVVVASGDARNVMRFVVGDFGDGYLGVSAGVTGRSAIGSFEDSGITGEIKLRTTAANNLPIWEIFRLKSLSGNVALANIFGQAVVVRGPTKGNVVDIATSHSGANDVTNSYNYRSGADDAELDALTVGDVLQISFFNNATRTLAAPMHGAVQRWEDEEDHTAGAQVKSDWNATSGDAEILNKPTLYPAAPAFREGALTDADTEHVQHIVDAVVSEGWDYPPGPIAAATYPYVREQTTAAVATEAQALTGSYGAAYTNGSTALDDRHLQMRLPAAYTVPRKRLELEVKNADGSVDATHQTCLLYTSPSPRD